jgi:spermidine synthase
VLDSVGAGARVLVAERVPRIVDLCRTLLSPLARDPLADPRVTVATCAVQEALAKGPFDLLLLDVDNGPDWATFRDNAWLYSDAGVRACAAALAPGGRLAVWSGYPAQRFLPILRRAGLQVSEVPLRVRGRQHARAYVGVRRKA